MLVLIEMLESEDDFGQKLLASATISIMHPGHVPNSVKAARGTFGHLVGLLSHSNETKRTRAARALSALSRTETNRHTIQSMGGIPALIKQSRARSSVAKVIAVRALWSLSFSTEIQPYFIQAGGVRALIGLMKENDEHLHVTGLRALHRLAKNRKNASAFASGIPQLMEFVRNGTVAQKSLAMNILKKLLRRTKTMAAICSGGSGSSLCQRGVMWCRNTTNHSGTIPTIDCSGQGEK